MTRLYHLTRSPKARLVCWIDTTRPLRPGSVVYVDGDAVAWTVTLSTSAPSEPSSPDAVRRLA